MSPKKRIWVPIDRGSYLEIPLTRGMAAKINHEHFDLVKGFVWFAAHVGANKIVAQGHSDGSKDRKTIRMSRIITGASRDKDVDHKNHDTVDNRYDPADESRNNLRVCTKSENMCNRLFKQSNTGYRNVFRDGCKLPYLASVSKGGRYVVRKHFATLVEARVAVLAGQLQYHGEFRQI